MVRTLGWVKLSILLIGLGILYTTGVRFARGEGLAECERATETE